MLAAEERSVRRRLAGALVPNSSGPVLGRGNVVYELAGRTRAVAHGGMGMVAKLVKALGLADELDASLSLLALHKPYYESDHVLNVAYNALCGGKTLDDIELRRRDQVFLDGIGAAALPDPTTAGDFCRRFDEASVMALQEAANRARLRAWAAQPASFCSQTAVIDADATIVPTGAEAKEGIDIAYNGAWGYSALMVSFANTKEPLYFKLSGANRPSHEGVVPLYDRAVALCRALATCCCEATPTSPSPLSSTAGTRAACVSSSATTPGPPWSSGPGPCPTSSTTSWWPGPSGP
jgi:hypothetical protein